LDLLGLSSGSHQYGSPLKGEWYPAALYILEFILVLPEDIVGEDLGILLLSQLQDVMVSCSPHRHLLDLTTLHQFQVFIFPVDLASQGCVGYENRLITHLLQGSHCLYYTVQAGFALHLPMMGHVGCVNNNLL